MLGPFMVDLLEKKGLIASPLAPTAMSLEDVMKNVEFTRPPTGSRPDFVSYFSISPGMFMYFVEKAHERREMLVDHGLDPPVIRERLPSVSCMNPTLLRNKLRFLRGVVRLRPSTLQRFAGIALPRSLVRLQLRVALLLQLPPPPPPGGERRVTRGAGLLILLLISDSSFVSYLVSLNHPTMRTVANLKEAQKSARLLLAGIEVWEKARLVEAERLAIIPPKPVKVRGKT